ncbi:MAG: large conductance mechanosensitive channel protein MscL [Thermoguttaceae bacterium]|jgi:large conductance mechanosensitive channel
MQPAKHVASFLEEFKKFALKGSVIDLAIGVIIGAAFAKIVNSLVFDIIMPVISIFLPGKSGFESWYLNIWGSKIPYGKFIGEIVNFVIIAIALYIFIVKFLGWIVRTKQQEAVQPPPLTKDQELLTEIRDLLKKT